MTCFGSQNKPVVNVEDENNGVEKTENNSDDEEPG